MIINNDMNNARHSWRAISTGCYTHMTFVQLHNEHLDKLVTLERSRMYIYFAIDLPSK